MSSLLVTKPVEVTNRLADLGWTVEDLQEVVSTMVGARRSCTENHPPSAPGWMSWADGIRRMRDIALPKGLIRADADGIPWTFDPVRNLRFAVANTDDGTGIEGRIPQNCSKKGAATAQAVNGNQLGIFDWLPEESEAALPKGKTHPITVVSWYLCVFVEGDIVRAELSCPVETEAGYFSDFSERIFVLSGHPGDEFTKRNYGTEDSVEPEYLISVTRK